MAVLQALRVSEDSTQPSRRGGELSLNRVPAQSCPTEPGLRPGTHIDRQISSGTVSEGRTVVPDLLDEGGLDLLCRALVRDCNLELPLDPWELCRRLGRRRRRAITLVAASLGGPHSVGHLVALPRSDKIFYDKAAARGLQAQIICHEVIHLVRGHLDDQPELTCGAMLLDPTASAPPTNQGRSPSLYAEWQEWEAEVGATYLSSLTRTRTIPARAPASGEEAGFAAAFGLEAPREVGTT